MDSASLNTTEDDPDLFFKEWEEEERLAKMHVVSAENDDDASQEVGCSNVNNNASSSNHGDEMERLEGEHLSVHSPDDGSLASDLNNYQDQFHQKQQKQPLKSKSKRGVLQRIGLGPKAKNNTSTNKSTKSLEGSEIVLDANSFIIDPSLLEKVQRETNFGKGVSFNAGSGFDAGIGAGVSSFHLVGSGSKKGTLEERSDASPRTITKLIFDQGSESSPLSQSKSLSKKKKHVLVIPATNFSASLDTSNSMDSDQENLHQDQARGTTTKPLHAPSQSLPQSRPHPQTAFARRWSFSSSVADDEEEQDEIHPNSLPNFAKSKSFSHRHHQRQRQHQHHRHRPGSAASSATATTRSSNPDYTSLDANQELFLKLSEDDDLRDFKNINNFSFEGDYLLSKILRERMRIQLKRDMLTTPDSKDLYLETHKRVSRSEMEVADDLMQERSVYFMI
jgi:hypothetical protein